MRRLGIAALLALLAIASLVPAHAATVQATQFWMLIVDDGAGTPIGYYILLGTGEAWLYTNGNISVTFNNGTVVTPAAGTYNYTGQDAVVRLEYDTVRKYAQIYDYTWNDTYVDIQAIKGNDAGLVTGIIACGYVSASITPINTDSYSWQPAGTSDNNKITYYSNGGTRTTTISTSIMGCSTWYAYEVYTQTYGSQVTIGANISASDWGIYAPAPTTVTVTTTATTTYTTTETITEAATTTVTETISLAPTETNVPANIAPDGRLVAIGAGLAFVLLLIIAAMVRR